jgi:uncharacterized membrane protein
MLQQESEPSTALAKYIRWFLLDWALFAAVIYVVSMRTQSDVSAIFGVLPIFAAAAMSARKFVQQEKRAMTIPERRRFTTLATMTTILLSLTAYTAIVLAYLPDYQMSTVLSAIDLSGLPATLALGAIALSALLSWVTIYITIGLFARSGSTLFQG